MASVAPAQTPGYFWSRSFAGGGYDYGSRLVTDGLGNVFVTGTFGGTLSLGGGNLVSAGGSDIFLAKYTAAGVHQWSQRFGSTSVDDGVAVAFDGSGNVIVTGNFSGSADFGGGALASAGLGDIFVAKYNSAGVHQWSKRFGAGSSDYGYGVAVDGLDNVIVTGSFAGAVDFGGGALASAGSSDAFVAKYNSDGTHQWSKRLGSTAGDIAVGVTVSGADDVIATGYFTGTVDFGGGNLVSAGSADIFIAKYNSAGAHQWSKRLGGTGFDLGYDVAADGSNDVLATGYFALTADFGGGNLVSAGSADAYFAKYNSSGAHQWSRRSGGTGLDLGRELAVDASGNAVVTGYFQDAADFGGGSVASAGGFDGFIVKYDAAGAHMWSRVFGSTLDDIGMGVAVDAFDNVLATGSFNAVTDFGGGGLLSAGDDVFIAKYGPDAAEPGITAIVDIANDQGRRVRIGVSGSGQDVAGTTIPVVQYEAFRRIDALPATTMNLAPGGPAGAEASITSLASMPPGDWEFVGAVPAHTEDGYFVVAPTLADSTIALGQHHSVFFIRAATDNPAFFYDSAPDSGYSLDNLAPGAPENFVFSTGDLTWDESTAADFDYFSVYGSNTNSFGSAVLIDYAVSPAMDVSASPYVFYFVTATDFSGNEGKPAMINTLSGTGGTPKSYVLSVSAYPNPFNPATTVRYTLPTGGRVTIAVYDVRGAHVATLVDETRPAGAYTVGWDAQGSGGERVGSGVYFVRLGFDGHERSHKVVLLQ